jgi:beta-xylosidase
MAVWYKHPDSKMGSGNNSQHDRKQLVLRSKESIYGPYERKLVFERGNGVERSCSQGALMQAPDGTWWYIHQLIQNTATPFQGRPPYLQPVTWVDGWPIIGVDIDNDGIGEPVIQYKKPIQGFPITGPQVDGDSLYIRTSNTKNKATFEYSLNGNTFERFGPVFTIKFGKWSGDRLGFFCWNELEEKGYIDVDWFTYDYDGPKEAKYINLK